MKDNSSSTNNLISSDEENENIDGKQVRASSRIIVKVSTVNVLREVCADMYLCPVSVR